MTELVKEPLQKITGRIIAGALVEDVEDPAAYMDVTVRIPKGLGRITMDARIILEQPEMLPVETCPHEGRTMAGGCLDCGDPSY